MCLVEYLSIWPAFTLPPLPQRRKKNLQTMPLLLSWASKALDIVTIKVIWRCVWFMFINSVFANWFPCIIYQQHCGLKFRALIEQILGFSKWLKEFLNLKSSYTIKRSSTVNYLNFAGILPSWKIISKRRIGFTCNNSQGTTPVGFGKRQARIYLHLFFISKHMILGWPLLLFLWAWNENLNVTIHEKNCAHTRAK